MIKLMMTALLAMLAMACLAGETGFPEPFGLNWSMTSADLQKIGFTKQNRQGAMQLYQSVSVPKAWSVAEGYVAITYKGKLVKVVAIGKSYSDDLLGSEGKKEYERTKAVLAKKYGAPSSTTEETGLTLYKDWDEFYQCLAYTGCGLYLSMFEINGGNIGLRLNGESRGKGYLTVAYESPGFRAAKESTKQDNEEKDEGAL